MTAHRSRLRRTTHVVAGSVLGALAFVVPVQHASAHRRTSVPRPAGQGADCNGIAHVGDSLTWAATAQFAEQYARRGWTDVRIDARGGRGIATFMYIDVTGIEAVRRIKATGFDGCWVMALGTNDTANTDYWVAAPDEQHAWRVNLIRSMMIELDGAPVVWVNTHLTEPDIDYSAADAKAWNAALREVAFAYPNMMIFDWDAVAADHPEWTKDDHVHDTPEGSTERARIVARAVTSMLRGEQTAADPVEIRVVGVAGPVTWWQKPFRRSVLATWPVDAPGP